MSYLVLAFIVLLCGATVYNSVIQNDLRRQLDDYDSQMFTWFNLLEMRVKNLESQKKVGK